jgi:glyoxylase-like metal-dependent hydrolase (beta-lactamase superfamily II)
MQRWKIGDVQVTKIFEQEALNATRAILPQATVEAVLPIEWLKPHFMDDDGNLKSSIHALVVETPTRKILVDTCVGNDKSRPRVPHWDKLQLPFLRDLEAAGYPPSSVDTVICTHLHIDHVGWNTMLVDGRWVPTFPNARYLMGKTEFDYWQAGISGEPPLGALFEFQSEVLRDSVTPVVDAGLVDLVEVNHQICEEVKLVPTLGHTPGHVSVWISSKGENAMITGDFAHHPCQLAHPEWSASVDFDKAQSAATRQSVFSDLAGTPTLVIGTHWTGATAGTVVRDGDGFRLVT